MVLARIGPITKLKSRILAYVGKSAVRRSRLDLDPIKGTGSPDSAPPVRALPRVQSALRVLVAEDNSINQKVITAILQKGGHSVQIAHNGAEAVDLSERCPYDVILMDVQMPVMDGHEATRAIRIRDRQTSQRTPIIALTAQTMPGDREACFAAGMDDYLAKPIKAADLLMALHRLQSAQPAQAML
jgi:two-component system sensor histidine kinase/response regulator